MNKYSFYLVTVLLLLQSTAGVFAQTNAAGSGYCLDFNGTTDYGEVQLPQSLNLPFTVEYWVRQDSITPNVNTVLSYEDDTADTGQPYYGFWTTVRLNGTPSISLLW